MTAIDEQEEFEFLYQMEKEAKAGIPPPNPAPVKASMGDVIAGTPLARLGMGLASPLIGAAQVGAHVGDLANRAMGVEPVVSPWIDKKLSEYEAAKQRGMKASGDEGFDAMGLLGSLVPAGAIAKGVTSALPAATSALSRMGTGAAIGGATSAAQPVIDSPEFFSDKGKQVGVGTAVGGVTPAVGEVVKALRGRAPQLTPPMAQTLKEGQAAGYVVPPSEVNPSFLTNRLESIAGKAAVKQDVVKRNQAISDVLAARDIEMPMGTPLTPKPLESLRLQTGKPYDEMSKLRPNDKTEWFKRFHQTDLVEQMKQAKADANNIRRGLLTKNDPGELSRAKELEKLADSIEGDLAILAKSNNREDLIEAVAKARVKIAKIHDVENVTSAVGEVSAPMVGRLLDQKPLTGNLELIGRFQQAFPKFMGEGAKSPVPGVSGTDAAASAILGTMGYGAGGPAGILAAGLPLLRGPARNLVLSKAYQKFATSDPAKYQALIDALAQRVAGAAGTAAGRMQP